MEIMGDRGGYTGISGLGDPPRTTLIQSSVSDGQNAARRAWQASADMVMKGFLLVGRERK